MNNATVLGVQTDDGSVAFTRRGDVRATEIGLLELGNGRLVLDDGGNPITVPADTIISIGTDGTVYGRDNQNPQVPPAPIALLMLRDASATPLVRRFDGLYDSKMVVRRTAMATSLRDPNQYQSQWDH